MNEKKPGRPKKEENKEVVVSQPLTHTAVSIMEKAGKWSIVTIKYNEAGEMGEMELHPQESKFEAVYNFKIFAANEVMPE